MQPSQLPERPEFPLEAPPQASGIMDGAIVAMKVGLSALLPGVGAVLGESLGGLIAHRNQEVLIVWLGQLQAQFNRHEEVLCNLQDPHKVDEVVAMAVVAGQAVIRTQHEEKRAFLRRAVLNTALAPTEGADERGVFVRFIDELTPSHIHLLRSLGRFKEHPEIKKLTSFQECWEFLKQQDPGFDMDYEGFRLFLMDLRNRGLINAGLANEMAVRAGGGRGLWFPELGERFLAFILEPETH